MKNLLGLGTLSFALLVTVGCGGKGKPLTPEQKAQWIELNASAGRSQTAAQDASRGVAQGRVFRLSDAYLADETGSTVSSSADMIRALSTGSCQFSDPQVSGSGSSFGMNFTVSGASCPITMRLMMAMNFDPSGSGSFDMDVDYRVVSDQFRSLNDVTAMKLSGGFTYRSSQTSASFGGTIKGGIQSTKLGFVPVRLVLDGSASQSGASYRFTATWTIQGNDVILLAEGTQNGMSYSLNGEMLDQDQFQAYLAQGGPVMAKAFQSRGGGN